MLIILKDLGEEHQTLLGEKAEVTYHSPHSSSSIGATTEAEQENLVPRSIIYRQI
jgi:hypothetical protein